MQALAPFAPVREGTPGMEQPGKLRRFPPADSPSFDVARGYSSQLFPWGRDSSLGQARSRLRFMATAFVVRVRGLLKVAPGRPER